MIKDINLHLQLTCRRLFLKDYVLSVHIGAHEFEKAAPQRVVFNVELYVPYSQSTPSTDNLNEVVDYDFIRQVIAKRVRVGHIELQETLCDELAAQLLKHPGVSAVRLSSCKPDVYQDCASVGVEVFRHK